jgi:diguanylate cyclase (GGDEF)-like protein
MIAHFWLTHLRIGFGLFAAESAAVMVFLLATPNGRYRPALWTVAACSALAAIAAAVLAPRVAAQSWRSQFSWAWTLVAGVALAVLAYLDNGIDSPLIALLWLPVVFAALALDPWPTAVTGLAGFVELIAVTVTDPNIPLEHGPIVMAFASMLGAVVLAVASSANRTRLQSHERALTDRLATLARLDGLTGCLNQRSFYERLDDEVARAIRYHQPLALMMVDIDDFKSVNDTFGHPHGDAVLARVGETARQECRAPDVIGRVGGDEFAIVVPQTSAAGAERLARRLLAHVGQPDGSSVTLSIGIAVLDDASPHPDRLMADADRALYQVKAAGRNGVAVYRPERLSSPAVPER